jgi:hypothetical protein
MNMGQIRRLAYRIAAKTMSNDRDNGVIEGLAGDLGLKPKDQERLAKAWDDLIDQNERRSHERKRKK